MDRRRKQPRNDFGLDWPSCSTGNAAALTSAHGLQERTGTVERRYRSHLRRLAREGWSESTS